MSARPDVVVLCLPRPEGERFAIFKPHDWFRAVPPPARADTWLNAVDQIAGALELLSEEAMRVRLSALGLDGKDVAECLARARRIAAMNMKGGIWEVVTAVGYRNEEGQEVVARTARMGSEPEQRVYLMRCTVCGHEYGTNGSDIPHRCCPNCQDGAG